MTEGRNQSEPDAAEEKKPVYVHCNECDPQCGAFYTPLKMDATGMRLMTAAGKGPCPMCASGKPMMGPSMTAIRKEQATMTNRSIDERADAWKASTDCGVSSKTLWGVMTGKTVRSHGYPHDVDDFGRCARLLALIPEWRARLHLMAGMGPVWEALAARWDEITASMEAETGIDFSKGRKCPKTYALIRSIIDPIEAKDGNTVRLGGGITISIRETPTT